MPDEPASQTATVTLRAVVDRIEDGDVAVLMIDAGDNQTQLDLPCHLLPASDNIITESNVKITPFEFIFRANTSIAIDVKAMSAPATNKS